MKVQKALEDILQFLDDIAGFGGISIYGNADACDVEVYFTPGGVYDIRTGGTLSEALIEAADEIKKIKQEPGRTSWNKGRVE